MPDLHGAFQPGDSAGVSWTRGADQAESGAASPPAVHGARVRAVARHARGRPRRHPRFAPCSEAPLPGRRNSAGRAAKIVRVVRGRSEGGSLSGALRARRNPAPPVTRFGGPLVEGWNRDRSGLPSDPARTDFRVRGALVLLL